MSNEWAEMLEASEAAGERGNDGETACVDDSTLDRLQLVDLSGVKIFDITGEDAAAFLQGQFCNDLNQVSSTRAQLTGYCSPKGRLLALPMIVGFSEGYRLVLPDNVAVGFVKRLSMFVMRSKVSIVERSDWLATGIIASDSGDPGQAVTELGALPVSTMDVASSEERQVIRWYDDYTDDNTVLTPGESTSGQQLTDTDSVDGGTARYLVLASVADQLALWARCDGARKRPSARWRLGDISAGIPSITTGVLEAFVPQMINLQLIDALSFTKGCYPGQEIVARMQYLGKLKRHMRRFRLPLAEQQLAGSSSCSINIVAGDKLATSKDADAGMVIDAVRVHDHYVDILAVVKVSTHSVPVTVCGHELLVMPLPYALPSLEELAVDAG